MKKNKGKTIAYAIVGVLLTATMAITVIGSATIGFDGMVQKAKEAADAAANFVTGGQSTVNADTLTEEDVQNAVKWIEEATKADDKDINALLDEYYNKFGYQLVSVQRLDGSVQQMRLVPFADDSQWQNDEIRTYYAQQAGLVDYPIPGALARPLNLSEEEKALIKSLNVGDIANMSQEQLLEKRDQLFRAFFENPILFEAFVRLLHSQQIGQTETFGAHWDIGTKFIQKTDAARQTENGIYQLWYTTINGQQYTLPEYHRYVAAVIKFLSSLPVEVVRLGSNPGEHYNLVTADFTDHRRAVPANRYEDLASLMFAVPIKQDGDICFRLGANIYDKRPEVLNYSIRTKTEAKASTPAKSRGSSGGSGGSTPSGGNTPGGGDTPGGKPEGTKSPADTKPLAESDGHDDDAGSGAWTEDDGNSPSSTTEGAAGHANTITNRDGGDSRNYDQGGDADVTHGGQTPDTAAQENKIGEGAGTDSTRWREDTSGQSSSSTSGNVSGALSLPGV